MQEIVMGTGNSSLNEIYQKFIAEYERTNCFEDAWLVVVNDFFIEMGNMLENCLNTLVGTFLINIQDFQDFLAVIYNFNIFSFVERFFFDFCIEDLKNYFSLNI